MSGVNTLALPDTRRNEAKGGLYENIVDHLMRPMRLGRLEVRLPGGRVVAYGGGVQGVHARMTVHRRDFFRKCVLFGDVGFGESYVDGDWDTDSVTKVIEWMILNVESHPTLMSDREKRSPVNLLKFLNNLLIPLRTNTLSGSRRNIHSHYDLGNEFFRLFLDPSMTYSSAFFRTEEDTLEEAQYQKYETLCRKIRLNKDDHVLEIGSGWGGFALYAARRYGCRVTTITVSRQQYDFVRDRIEREGLEERARVAMKDYREIDGRFDKIVSIEMLEAVGHAYYEAYFRQCHRLLKKDGILGLQVILSPDNRYDSFRRNVDWIQKHVFPGSLLPSFAVLQRAVNRTGDLCLHDFEDMTQSYARTLRQWFDNFNGRLDEARSLGLSEAFIRKWNYYLCYCEAAFRMRNIAAAQIVFSRPNNAML